MRNIFILALNDFACSLRNKSFFLVFFIPIFIFVIFQLLDRNNSELSKFRIGLSHQISYAPKLMQALQSVEKNIEIVWVNTVEEGRLALKEHQVYAVLEPSEQKADQLVLVVLKKEAPQTLALSRLFSDMQNAAEKNNVIWIAEVKSLREGNIQKQTLPTWILMVVLLVGFIILPAQVAEEKEKKLLLALLQTPIHEIQWVLGKIILGISLSVVAVLLLQILNQVVPVNIFAYVAFIFVASFCFSAFGLFLGFLCRNQASARTLGIVFYLPSLVPVALSDFSKKLSGILAFVPSNQFYQPLQVVIFENGVSTSLIYSWAYLFFLGVTFSGLSYFLIKKRWLMS